MGVRPTSAAASRCAIATPSSPIRRTAHVTKSRHRCAPSTPRRKDQADWSAVDLILAKKNITVHNHSPEDFQKRRNGYAQGMGGFPIVGDHDKVAIQFAELSRAGLRGIGI